MTELQRLNQMIEIDFMTIYDQMRTVRRYILHAFYKKHKDFDYKYKNIKIKIQTEGVIFVVLKDQDYNFCH